MAKVAAISTTQPKKEKDSTPLIPRPTDPRAEMFYLLGRIEMSGVDGARRLTELVIELTAAPAPATAEGE